MEKDMEMDMVLLGFFPYWVRPVEAVGEDEHRSSGFSFGCIYLHSRARNAMLFLPTYIQKVSRILKSGLYVDLEYKNRRKLRLGSIGQGRSCPCVTLHQIHPREDEMAESSHRVHMRD